MIALTSGVAIAAVVLFLLLPGRLRNTGAMQIHFSIVAGIIFRSMMIGFVGFIWTRGIDLYFKILVDLVGMGLLIISARQRRLR